MVEGETMECPECEAKGWDRFCPTCKGTGRIEKPGEYDSDKWDEAQAYLTGQREIRGEDD